MFYFHDFVTYTSDGLYTTHPNGLPHPTRAFQIDEQNGAIIPKQPDAIDFNSPHHYYLPFGKNVQQKKKMYLLYQTSIKSQKYLFIVKLSNPLNLTGQVHLLIFIFLVPNSITNI